MNIDILYRPTALENLLAGRIWPAGRRLPMHVLKNAPITLKRVIDTRWSAHRAAVNALHTGFDEIMDALEELCNPSENLNTRGDAHGILEAIQSFTFFSFLCFWKVILRESHDAQTYLQ